MSSERICVIHVGTHKTATTSQQYFLKHNASALLAEGLFFPSNGWYGVVPGHHGVAWELFSRTDGPVLQSVLDEIAASDAPAAILSAEDFTPLYAHPSTLAALAEAIRGIGYTPRILIYLRPQAPFAESMYVERVKHNDATAIDEYVAQIASTGRYVINADLQIEFRYSRILESFSAAFGKENVYVRLYEGLSDISRAFSGYLEALSTIGEVFQNKVVSLDVSHPLINESLSFIRLLGTLFTVLNPGAEVPATAQEFISAYAPDLPREYEDARFALLRRDDYLTILNSVSEDNLLVEKLYGVRVPFITSDDVPSLTNAMWAKAQVERKIYDRCFMQWSAS
jgi:hypothetical protein